jgi:uncharacterized protein (DUF1330 family)
MAGYFLIDIVWIDDEGRKEYFEGVGDTVAAFGGEFVTRGPEYTSLEGGWELDGRLVLLRFPTAEVAMAWYNSEAYAPLLALRQRCAHTKIIFFEGN